MSSWKLIKNVSPFVEMFHQQPDDDRKVLTLVVSRQKNRIFGLGHSLSLKGAEGVKFEQVKSNEIIWECK